eukprot:CAMPEP_0177455314 /NCGR_PEP_ID=MMETSP0369-20130122/11838_1 /TAXON_ID=447022 ORGANISM="Scrippsiella hangoei-like, Strain SHHI-4" /NCGR_SAMPLE_ID=MMETSP0369 /ASSEMBLY_ACC=CAM_ASM_000364 /LENGTH=78 /DNA_ID=CAMNT_0018928171 /DNA_START=33 /DNA_END=269 /DNA_ORIENTATION=-
MSIHGDKPTAPRSIGRTDLGGAIQTANAKPPPALSPQTKMSVAGEGSMALSGPCPAIQHNAAALSSKAAGNRCSGAMR